MVMPIYEGGIFLLRNHPILCYPCHADSKTVALLKIRPFLVQAAHPQKNPKGSSLPSASSDSQTDIPTDN